MYLVIRIEKVLQGDVTDSIDPYMNKDDKSRDRLRANAFLCCEKLGRNRQVRITSFNANFIATNDLFLSAICVDGCLFD